MSWKLGLEGSPTTIYKPTNFDISEVEIAKKGRVASGKLVKDIIARKKVFSLSYNVLSASQINDFLTEKARDSELEFTYEFDGGDVTATVMFSSFRRRKLLTPLERWGNVVITLEEV